MLTKEATLHSYEAEQNSFQLIEKNEIWSRYLLPKNDILIDFEDKTHLFLNYIIKSSPGEWSSENSFLINNNKTTVFFNNWLEICKPFYYAVQIPYSITWHSRHTFSCIQLKTQLAYLPDMIQHFSFQPNGKFKLKHNKKENYLGLANIKIFSTSGHYTGNIIYDCSHQTSLNSNDWGKITEIDPIIKQRYTQLLPFWRDSPELEHLLEKIPKDNTLLRQCLAVYSFVRNFIVAEDLDYRKGTVSLLKEKTPRGDCDEYTDLIIALLRSLKIPARRFTGIVYPNIFHAWPEVFSPKQNRWFPLDAAQQVFGFLSCKIAPLRIEGTKSERPTIEIANSSTLPTKHITCEVNTPTLLLKSQRMIRDS